MVSSLLLLLIYFGNGNYKAVDCAVTSMDDSFEIEIRECYE